MPLNMALDLVFVLILILMVALGAWKGAVPSGSGLFSMIAGYAGAILFATSGADWVAHRLSVSPLMAPAVAGSIGFFLFWLIASCLAGIVVAWDKLRVEGMGRGLFDRSLGGFFGLARGSLIVVLLALLTNWLDAARDLGVVEGLAALPESESSHVAGMSGDLVEAAVGAALSGNGKAGEIAARITARPGQALGGMQTILEDERLTQMFEDKLFWTLISNDSVDYAMNRQAIRSIVHDEEMRGRFADLGLVPEEARENPSAFRETMAGVLAKVGPSVKRLQEDPEIQNLAQDPEIIALVESGNTFALLRHPRIQALVDEVTADL
ncbi:MAG: CvpA family protein [Myxococcota bacterium]